jgi:hypothetical protein
MIGYPNLDLTIATKALEEAKDSSRSNFWNSASACNSPLVDF